eukprot:1644190-Prymnesium_polylepis.1
MTRRTALQCPLDTWGSFNTWNMICCGPLNGSKWGARGTREARAGGEPGRTAFLHDAGRRMLFCVRSVSREFSIRRVLGGCCTSAVLQCVCELQPYVYLALGGSKRPLKVYKSRPIFQKKILRSACSCAPEK